MKRVQEQQMIEKRIEIKLDKITVMLDAIMKGLQKEEPELDKKLIRKITKEWKAINAGTARLHHYNSLAEFESSIG